VPPFKIHADHVQTGDQPPAIDHLVEGSRPGEPHITPPGATGTGRTFTSATVPHRPPRPHNAHTPTHALAPTTALAASVLSLLDLADRYYQSAERGMHYLPAAARPAILVASRLYRAIGDALRRRGGNPLLGRAFVPPSERPFLIVQALRAATAHALGTAPRGPHDASLHDPLAGFPGILATPPV